MKATFSSIIMEFITFWTFTSSQCLSARQYFPVLNKREQQEYRSKFKPLLALSVRILMAPTLPCLVFIASSCFMWQYLGFMPCFLHINLSISQSRARCYAHFREQKKHKVRWFGCGHRAALLGADLCLISHHRNPLHLQQETLPLCRQAHMGCESKACTKLGRREWASPCWLLGALHCSSLSESSTQKRVLEGKIFSSIDKTNSMRLPVFAFHFYHWP